MRVTRRRRRNQVWALASLALALSCSADATAQSAAGRRAFEVVSVKPSAPGGIPIGVISGAREGDRWRSSNVTLRLLIQSGYRNEFPMTGQIIGGPDWMDADRFDVTGSMPAGTTAAEMNAMVRSMLADRFGLRVHREERELPVYALRIARSDGRLGPQIRPLTIDCDALRAARLRGEAPPMPPPSRDSLPDCFTGIGAARLGYDISSGGISMSELARHVSEAAGRPVFDRTGLTGFFALTLRFATEPGAVSPLGGRPAGVSIEAVDLPSLAAAVEEQLGLKLESSRERVSVLIIDGAQRPTEN